MKIITKLEIFLFGLFMISGIGTSFLSTFKHNKIKINKSLNTTKIFKDKPEIKLISSSIRNTSLIKKIFVKKTVNYNDMNFPYKLKRDYITKYILLLIISSIMLLLSFLKKNYIVNFIEFKIKLSRDKNFTYDYILQNIDYILSIEEVRDCLFNNDNSYFKNKYGKKFSLQNSDYILLKKEVLGILTHDLNIDMIDKLIQNTVSNQNRIIDDTKMKIQLIVHEKIRLESELKYDLIVYSIRGALFFACFISIFSIFSTIKNNSMNKLN